MVFVREELLKRMRSDGVFDHIDGSTSCACFLVQHNHQNRGQFIHGFSMSGKGVVPFGQEHAADFMKEGKRKNIECSFADTTITIIESNITAALWSK